MAVQQEIKSQLAKLLATEDIVVEHKRVTSAQFNVRTRVLILPLWEKASHDVYDMLVGHEVGHALFTPDDDWWLEYDIPQQFVNVVEDARIEKLMKRKYLGIAKSFYKGYNELHEQDYFEIDGQDINSLNLADRANLHFKLSSILPISFSPSEKQIITLIENAETFTETLSAAEALYNFCKQEKERDSKEKEKQAESDFKQDLADSNSSSSDIPLDNNPSVSDPPSSDVMEDRSSSDIDTSGSTNADVTVETADKLESKLQDLIDHKHVVENVYVEVPKVNLENIIVSNEGVHQEIDNDWEKQRKMFEESTLPLTLKFDEIDADYIQFKRDAQKEVSYLVKEFECRKSASAYSRSSTSRTGVLDTTKLQTYRFNEDLFKRVTTLPDGKNHGLVFILDWSGSMQYVLQDTLKQLYNLIWFCRKVQIPFEVYAFTNEWERGEVPSVKSERREGVLYVSDDFNLMNLFSSKVNAKTLEHQMINIWRIAQAFRVRSTYTYPQRLVLSGTPLNETLVSLHQILPQFQKENNVEKVQCVILTDGEAPQLPFHKSVQRHWEDEPYLGCRSCHPDRTFLRDRKVGKTYKVDYGYHQFADMLLVNLKDRFPSTNFIGIRVLNNRDAKSFMRLYDYREYDRMAAEWKRTKAFTVKDSGYDAYFAMSANSLAEDVDFDVDEDATKAQIKRAFVKSLKTKKLNKKVLGEFIELVA
jgi:hypothetical protein